MAMAARTTAVVSFAICFIFGVGCSWRGAVANGDGSWGGCVDNESSCGVAFKLSNRFFGALARARFFFGFRPRLLGIGKQWVGGLVRSRIRYPLLANAVQRLLTAMVGQDREEANRLQQAKWELTSRIRDESNVPNAFKAGPRIGIAPLPGSSSAAVAGAIPRDYFCDRDIGRRDGTNGPTNRRPGLWLSR